MNDQTPFKAYFKELHAVAQPGDAREESSYPVLADMLKTVADATGRPGDDPPKANGRGQRGYAVHEEPAEYGTSEIDPDADTDPDADGSRRRRRRQPEGPGDSQ